MSVSSLQSLLVLLASFFCCFKNVISAEYKISTASDFSTFVNNVNTKTTYLGTTVFLETDLSLSAVINAIGFSDNYQFRGTFDGKGHIISDLKIDSSLANAGLFGFSRGLTIKNVVLDSSCSITSSKSDSFYFIGGMLGYCQSLSEKCIVESVVNMAAVTFSKSISGGTISLGGIVGKMPTSPEYEKLLKNCVNYGAVTFSGTCSNLYIGGIVGEGDISSYGYVYNCLNYGTITHSGKTSNNVYMGGIKGISEYTYIENCVSAGKIVLSGTYSTSRVGNIIGNIYSSTYIDNCYFTSNVGVTSLYGIGTPSGVSNTPTTSTSLSTAATNLNSKLTSDNGWNKWILNSNSMSVTFKVNNSKGFSLSSQIILLPDLNATDPLVFNGWYIDSYYINPFQSNSVSSSMMLYSSFDENIVVYFDSNGGSVDITSKIIFTNKPYGELPTPTRDEAIFEGWFNEKGESVTSDTTVNTASNHILCAHWTINNYTITFVFDNGTDNEVRMFEYNSSVTYPDDPVREGYTFDGWNKSDITNMPAENITIMALWAINNYTIMFVFDNGTDNEVRMFEYNSLVSYPDNPVREGYTFDGWNKSDITNIPAENLTIVALWTANNYTVTFNVSGGIKLADDENNVTVTFNNAYGELPSPTREGYEFDGWFNVKGESITNDTIVNIPDDHTFHAQWTPNNYTVVFNVSGGDELADDENNVTVTFDNVYGHLPTPTREGYEFVGWFNEEDECTTNDTIVNIPDDHTLHAQWTANTYIVVFNFGYDDKTDVRSFDYDTQIDYPDDPIREGYTFSGWNPKPVNMPANNLTTMALWTANNYTVTFNLNGGDSNDKQSMNITFNSTYGKLPLPIKSGYEFLGWFNEKNESVTSDTIVSTASNHVLYAQWKEILVSQVEIVFEKKDLTDEEIKEIVKQYTDADFTIVKVEDDKTGEVRIIIKFIDIEKAEEFVRNVSISSGSARSMIKNVEFNSEVLSESFSSVFYPILFFHVFLI